jgi:hypothetical protein
LLLLCLLLLEHRVGDLKTPLVGQGSCAGTKVGARGFLLHSLSPRESKVVAIHAINSVDGSNAAMARIE